LSHQCRALLQIAQVSPANAVFLQNKGWFSEGLVGLVFHPQKGRFYDLMEIHIGHSLEGGGHSIRHSIARHSIRHPVEGINSWGLPISRGLGKEFVNSWGLLNS